MKLQIFESCRSDHFPLSVGERAIDAPAPGPIDLVRLAEALATIGRGTSMLAQAIAQNGSENSHSLPSHSHSFSLAHSHSLSLAPPKPVDPPVAPPSLTLRDVVDEFLAVKTRALRSDRYLRQLKVSLNSFARGKAKRPISEIKPKDVEDWIFSQGWKPRTMKGYLADVRTLFTFAWRRGYVATTAAAHAVETPIAPPDHSSPGIHTPDQVRQVLEAVRLVNKDVMRHLAIRYFTGVRSAEAFRLRECDLLADGFLSVPADKAKTRRRRLIRIQPTLAAWLALGGTLRPLGEMTVRKTIRKAVPAVPWPGNVTRHSFVSYHLAMWENAGKTALEAGHSEAMLFAHYRALVTQESARAFWALLPLTPPGEALSP